MECREVIGGDGDEKGVVEMYRILVKEIITVVIIE